MNLSHVERIVNAVLYEGYILYPYRPSAVKNRQRWNFGALYPRSYSDAQQGTDAWSMQTECLVEGNDRTVLDVKIRFLHLVSREVGRLAAPLAELPEGEEPDHVIVSSLEIGGQHFQTWQEAVEREVSSPGLHLGELAASKRVALDLPAKREIEALRDTQGQVPGIIIRRQQAIKGEVEIQAERAGADLFKLTIRILNLTPFAEADRRSRDEALMHTLVSTHTILGARDGEFVSLLDPPERCRQATSACLNIGAWPVLVGEEGERDCLLSSPIILYDYPQVAPESAGDLFDGTEIDEILTLRILTLTDEEKREMRGADDRARQILERTETLPPEQLMKLHGVMRSLRPASEKKP